MGAIRGAGIGTGMYRATPSTSRILAGVIVLLLEDLSSTALMTLMAFMTEVARARMAAGAEVGAECVVASDTEPIVALGQAAAASAGMDSCRFPIPAAATRRGRNQIGVIR